jgi:imidazolonepropionase-like amidohydrolase
VRIWDGTGAEPFLGSLVLDPGEGVIREVLRDRPDVGSTSDGSAPGDADTEIVDGTGLTALPGLIDSHAHLMYREIFSPFDLELRKSPVEATVDAIVNARELLAAGFTTIRDMGSRSGIGVAVAHAIGKGDVPGPRMRTAGRILSSPGGGGDIHPAHLFGDDGYDSSLYVLVKDPWDTRNTVRRQAAAGVDWIKIALSGTGVNLRCPPHRDGLGDAEFEAAVDQARREGLPIAVHAESARSTLLACRAGVASIEHGVAIDDECAELMVEHGTVLVPTMACYTAFGERGAAAGRPAGVVAAHQAVHEQHLESVRRAYAAGVPIAAGGDAGGAHFPQGSAIEEAQQLVRLVGMSNSEALQAITLRGAQLLGIESEVGTLRPGMAADVVLVRGNPVDDITDLASPGAVAQVFQAGRRVGPGS